VCTHYLETISMYPSSPIITMIKSRRIRCAGHVTRAKEVGTVQDFSLTILRVHTRLLTYSLALRSSKKVGPFYDRCPLSLALASCLHLFTFSSSKSWQSSTATQGLQWAQTWRTFQLYSGNPDAWICFRNTKAGLWLDKRKPESFYSLSICNKTVRHY
jgi:hypothetical protein